jgi:anti-sigma regulatory factor (Ser/Thr protein kinase)
MRRMFERRVPRRIDALESLVTAVREFLAAEGLDEDRAFRLDLVAEELFTNLVRHADGDGDIRLSLARVGDDIRLTLRAASSEPFDPTALPEADLSGPVEERRSGGMGIHMVRSLTSRLDYHRDGADDVVTATLRPEA